jgi:P-type E1-E2 ATPase
LAIIFLAVLSLTESINESTVSPEIALPGCVLTLTALGFHFLNYFFKKNSPNKTSHTALVTRNGQQVRIDSEGLVAGDVVHIQSGEIIPADMRIVQADFFKVDNVCVTGEARPLRRTENPSDEESQVEANNIIFKDTYASEGSCKAIVIRTGVRTLCGHYAHLFPTYWVKPFPACKD